MKIISRLLGSLLVATALIALVFSFLQKESQQKRLYNELSLKAELLARSFEAGIAPLAADPQADQKIYDYFLKFENHERLLAIIVYLKNGQTLYIPQSAQSIKFLATSKFLNLQKDESVEFRAHWDKRPIHVYGLPLTHGDKLLGALVLVHDSSYIRQLTHATLKFYGIVFLLLALVLSITVLVVVQSSVIAPIARITEWSRRLSEKDVHPHADLLEEKDEIGRLLFEVAHMAEKLKAVRVGKAKQEQLSPASNVWTREQLKKVLKTQLGDNPLYVVANREPYLHTRTETGIHCVIPPSGMVTALDPVLQTVGGVWVAHGSGDADKETSDEKGRIQVPPENPAYLLRRVWLDEEEEKGFYYGFSNEGIWPLCHIAHTRPIFRLRDWELYKEVNQKFADILLEELGNHTPYVLVQDYHFALLPKYIKEKRPDARIALFWHIPWPNPEVFGICPWKEEILEGMLGSDLIGFHTQYHCNNFLDTVDRVLESRIDWTNFAVTKSGEITLVRPFPISIDPFGSPKQKEKRTERMRTIVETYQLQGKIIGLGVDRIDYIKGLLERFISLDRFFEKYPQFQGKLVFIELGAPSRAVLPGYIDHLAELERQIAKINEKYGTPTYKPVIFLKEHHSPQKVRDFYQLADFCLVNSLHDGMNLVAKEYVAAKEDLNGALILSRFTGASLELKGALLINPYNIEQTADAIHQAMTMAPEEKRERMGRMRTQILENNIFRWAGRLVTDLVKSF